MAFPIAAALTAGGSLLGGLFGARGQRKANQQNIALAREQMAFQERMSNSAYQRAMKDMKLAGLNPILSAKQPASTPGGASTKVDSVLGAGVQAFNNTNSALASAANQRASARANSAVAYKQEFINENFANKNMKEPQKAMNAALMATGMNAAIANAAQTLVNENHWREFRQLMRDASTEIGVQMGDSMIKNFWDGLKQMGQSNLPSQYRQPDQVRNWKPKPEPKP